jgi:hypothetical protein
MMLTVPDIANTDATRRKSCTTLAETKLNSANGFRDAKSKHEPHYKNIKFINQQRTLYNIDRSRWALIFYTFSLVKCKQEGTCKIEEKRQLSYLPAIEQVAFP